jgi:glucokinase
MKYYIGIDLGGTNIVAAVVDENHKILSKEAVETGCPRPSLDICNEIAMLSYKAAQSAQIAFKDIEWIGVGSPGIVNVETGIVEYANNLGFDNVPLAKIVEEKTQKKVYIENDANAAAYGEVLAGAARGKKHAIVITLGTGVGSGIIIDSKIYSGFNFAGAEIGHIVIKKGGRPCSCGQKGCFETYASATGLIKTTKEYMLKNKKSVLWDLCDNDIKKITGKTAFDAMKSGDKTGEKVINEYTSDLATGITNILNIFQPEVLCIGGGISKEGNYLLNPLIRKIHSLQFDNPNRKHTEIVCATLGNDAGIIGAAMLGNLR